jgi:hypothetical protein
MKNKIVSLIFILFISNFTFLIFHSSIAYAIEVGGHLTEDTTWSPNNNPYHVIDDIYVDNNITLTILPGTIVKFNAAPLVNENSINDYFVHYNGSNVAKMLWVDGKVIANGTEEEPITFTRFQDSLYYHWGIIYLREEADLSSFKYCYFKNSALMLIVLGIIPRGAISIYNEGAIVENCNFIDNLCGVFIDKPVGRLEVNYNNFYNIDNICPNYIWYVAGGIKLATSPTGYSNPVLIAGNSFLKTDVSWGHVTISNNTPTYVVDNYFLGENGIHANMESDFGSYIYNNEFINCDGNGGAVFGGEENNALYIKKNNFIGGYDGIAIDDAYVEISVNYFEGCDIYTEFATGKIYSNVTNNGEIWSPGEIEVYNNICSNNDGYGLKVGYNPYCVNNISINNEYDIWSATVSYENSIIIGNDELTQYYINGNPIFRNCIIDFPLEEPLIDGGGNIWVDSLQVQTLFEDITNGDFHLIEGSLAIDAGFDTLGYYYPFDIDYNHRVWDGDNNGTAIIDIGPYEFGSPTYGGIEGYTYNPLTNEPVDYVLLKINDQPGEFTFSDSIGNFEYKLPAGIYDIYAERVFYEDVIEYQVEVIDDQFTQIAIPMFEMVDVEENTIPNFSSQISNLTNYPNPFNPTTTISFSLPENGNVELSIYNVKGQKVTTLINEQMQSGKHTAIWSGLDSNNKSVSSGIYLYKIKAGNQESAKRMLLLK